MRVCYVCVEGAGRRSRLKAAEWEKWDARLKQHAGPSGTTSRFSTQPGSSTSTPPPPPSPPIPSPTPNGQTASCCSLAPANTLDLCITRVLTDLMRSRLLPGLNVTFWSRHVLQVLPCVAHRRPLLSISIDSGLLGEMGTGNCEGWWDAENLYQHTMLCPCFLDRVWFVEEQTIPF